MYFACRRKRKVVVFIIDTTMKRTPNENLRELRRTLGQTQDVFAATIGVSKDTVASWETGRNRISAALARRIALATGVDERALLKGNRPLLTRNPARRPFTREECERHQKSFWGETAEESGRRALARCTDARGLLDRAAAETGEVCVPARVACVIDSLM